MSDMALERLLALLVETQAAELQRRVQHKLDNGALTESERVRVLPERIRRLAEIQAEARRLKWTPEPEAKAPDPHPFACPACNGHGTVSRPPNVAGDAPQWTLGTSAGPFPCRACGGKGIVWRDA